MTPEDHERLTRMRRCADLYPREFHDYAFLLKIMDERVSDLMDANSRLVAERNEALAEAHHHQESVDFLLRHNGVEAMRRLESENQILRQQREDALHEARIARSQAEIFRDRVDQADRDHPILNAARRWAQSIHTLRRAMRPNESDKKGSVLAANQSYTAAHLGLLALIPDTFDK